MSLVSIQDGVLRKGAFFLDRARTWVKSSKGDRIASCYTRKKYEITELGIMHPEEVPTSQLLPGQVGYIACNMKQSSEGEIFKRAHFDSPFMLRWQPTLVIHYIVSGILSSPCLAFNPPKPWCVRPLCNESILV